jgi:hypothetical protein
MPARALDGQDASVLVMELCPRFEAPRIVRYDDDVDLSGDSMRLADLAGKEEPLISARRHWSVDHLDHHAPPAALRTSPREGTEGTDDASTFPDDLADVLGVHRDLEDDRIALTFDLFDL